MSLDAAFFVSPTIHARKVKLPDGAEHQLHFRELPAAEFTRYHLAQNSGDDEAKVGAIAKLICASLCEADGKPALTFAKAMQLKVGAMSALFEAVLSVNSSANAGNASAPGEGSGSGTSSPSHSVDEPSPSGKA